MIERIFDHCLQRGWLKRGDLVGDAFGGVGLGGIVAAYRGLAWVGIELEPRFVKFAQANFALHADKWRRLGCPQPEIVQGDSRKFHEVVIGAGAIVTSPPYSEGLASGGQTNKPGATQGMTGGKHCFEDYGETPGQIGLLKSGEVAAVVTLPPYVDSMRGLETVNIPLCVKCADVLISQKSISAGLVLRVAEQVSIQKSTIGGSLKKEQPEDYWWAMQKVYSSCYTAIKPNGIMAVVVKDYVSKGKRVPLCDDTVRLLEHCGFQIVERVHAMLTKETRHGDLFKGETTTTKSRKSFFRRLAEKKGSPAIDFEEVIFAKRP